MTAQQSEFGGLREAEPFWGAGGLQADKRAGSRLLATLIGPPAVTLSHCFVRPAQGGFVVGLFLCWGTSAGA